MRLAIERIDAVIGASHEITEALAAIERGEGDWGRLRESIVPIEIEADRENNRIYESMHQDANKCVHCRELNEEQQTIIEHGLMALYRCWIIQAGLNKVDPPRDLPEGTDLVVAVVDAAGISVAGVRAEADVRITAEKARVRAEMGAAGK